MNRVPIFLLSLFFSTIALLIERVVGIGWDFHPDSVTYATKSTEFYENIVDDIFSLPNNFYYVIVHFLEQNIIAVTALNIIIYSLTNVLIFQNLMEKYGKKSFILICVIVYINPYRLHLSTTMLKDTLIIYLLAATYINHLKILPFVTIFLTRIVSVLYFIPLMPKKYFKYLVLIFVLLMVFDFAPLVDFLIKSSENEMTFRDFDSMPTFQNLGLLGSFFRGIVWAALTFSGLFLFVSPSLMFFPVSFGIFITLFAVYKLEGRIPINVQFFSILVLFGVLVTGFTSYLRYVYPVICLYPIFIARKKNV